MHERAYQASKDRAQSVAAVEAELDLGQVAVGVLAELDGVVRAAQCRLDVADDRVDGLEL
jgi:hypothetical protein